MALFRSLVALVAIVSVVIEAKSVFDSFNHIDKNNSTLKFNPTRVYQIDNNKEYKDCHARWLDGEQVPGVYVIHPKAQLPVQVYCNHSVDTSYTVIQRRYYGNENFNRGWAEYKAGFGALYGDHWLGLDTISLISLSGKTNLMIQMTDWRAWGGTTATIYLRGVQIQPEYMYYRLTYTSYSGSLVNDLSMNNGMYFYSPDRPDLGNCALYQKCGWWFNAQQGCTNALLNGVYYPGGAYTPGTYYDGIYYKHWHGYSYSLRYVTMSLYK